MRCFIVVVALLACCSMAGILFMKPTANEIRKFVRQVNKSTDSTIPVTVQAGNKQFPSKEEKNHHDRNATTPTKVSTKFASLPPTTLPTTQREGSCCYHEQPDLRLRFTKESWEVKKPAYFKHEYETWLTAVEMVTNTTGEIDCKTKWMQTALMDARGQDLGWCVGEVTSKKESALFRCVEDQPGLPRILLLGDSISGGIWMNAQCRHGPLNMANIHAPPSNCFGFPEYNESLSVWLSNCPWDLIQFNVGHHFHPSADTGLAPCAEGTEDIIVRLRQHSPKAKIVFALSAPSPFDSEGTFPNKESCPNYDLFHKKGLVSELNQVASKVATRFNVTTNDRYSLVVPELKRCQNPCDIHCTGEGYDLLANDDWKLFSKLLNFTEDSS